MSRCELCFHHCELKDGQRGFCLGRVGRDGQVVCDNAGFLTALALDPVEKKPLARFHPGKKILSAGSYGCNLKCPFCQNYEISYDDGREAGGCVSPEALVNEAERLVPEGNIGLAFTYNEPMIAYEYTLECFELCHGRGLKTVIVTNGTVEEAPLLELLQVTDAMNIDLKGWHQDIYDRLQGDLESVKRTITLAARACHVEVTSLIVPGLNDSLSDMDEEAEWLASLSPDIPLHISRYFPRYHYHEEATDVSLIYDMKRVAEKHLHYVYTGNC